jgi:hypothetical protein
MSDTPSTPKPAPGFLWFVAVFLGFGILAALLTAGSGPRSNPRDTVRATEAGAVREEQNANLAKMGLEKGKSKERLAKAVEDLKALPAPAPSKQVVPGSATQMKQAASAPAQAAAAPATAAPLAK